MVDSVFFFKQKTAYEMRISDWSSDVCSSDLIASRAAARCRDAAGGNAAGRGWCSTIQGIDRKSVVKGKSVSVRVDLGGRRIIKKKKEVSDPNRVIKIHQQNSQQL